MKHIPRQTQILGNKTILNKLRKIEIIFSDHSRIKPEITNRMRRESPSSCKLNNQSPNKP